MTTSPPAAQPFTLDILAVLGTVGDVNRASFNYQKTGAAASYGQGTTVIIPPNTVNQAFSWTGFAFVAPIWFGFQEASSSPTVAWTGALSWRLNRGGQEVGVHVGGMLSTQ
jgi:hypothetical protein